MTKKKKKILAREKKQKRMLNAIGHYAVWREMDCPVRIIGVAESNGLKEGDVAYKGIREAVDNCGLPIIPHKKVLKENHVYIVELPEPVEVELPEGGVQKASALFLSRRDLSAPIHPDLIEKIEKARADKFGEET